MRDRNAPRPLTRPTRNSPALPRRGLHALLLSAIVYNLLGSSPMAAGSFPTIRPCRPGFVEH